MRGQRALAYATAAAAGVALALAGFYPGNNPDTFGHLAQGRQIAELGHVPKLDTWSLLPGPPRPWINYEWLSDLCTWKLYAAFGYDAVTYFKGLLLLATALCLGTTARSIAGVRACVLTSLVLVSAIPAIRVRLSDRPHVLGIALAAAYLLLLVQLDREVTRSARRRCFGLVALLTGLHLVWVNAHGSHMLGIAIAGSFLLLGTASARKWVAGVLGLQLAVSCVSPYGPAIWVDALKHVFDPRYRALITEWLPWQEHDPPWQQLGPALQGAIIAISLPPLLRSPTTRPMLAVALLLGVACFRSVRFSAEFMLLSAPLAGIGLARFSEALSVRTFTIASAAIAGLFAGFIPPAAKWITPWQPFAVGESHAGLPYATGRMLARYGKPRVFAVMQDSWYLMFAAPNSRFVLDGRAPFYGPDHVFRFALALANGNAMADLQREEHFNTVVVRHTISGEQQLGSYLDKDWSLVLIEDSQAAYVAEGALTAEGMRRYPPIRALQPFYDMDWAFDASPAAVGDMHAELARLKKEPGTSGYCSWVEAILMLAPLRRGAAGDGFHWPRSDAEWALYRRARPLVEEAARRAPRVPVIAALQAQLAALFCDLDAAREALARVSEEGASREPLLTALEIALRNGEREQVRSVVARARAMPQGQHDVWLAELAQGVDHPPSCPR